MAYIFSIFFLCVGLFCKAQDTVFVAECEHKITITKKQSYELKHKVYRILDTFLLVQEFYNNSLRFIFTEPEDSYSGGCVSVDSKNKAFVFQNIGFQPDSGEHFAYLLLPKQKITRYYTFYTSGFFDLDTYPELTTWRVAGIGQQFSFFEALTNVPLYNYITRPYYRGYLSAWCNNSILQFYNISLTCEIPKGK